MNILVFNCGSSSLKYRLIGMPGEEELAGGEAQRIGPPTAEPPRIEYRVGKQAGRRETPMANHAEALAEVMGLLAGSGCGMPDAVAHRLVHGGNLVKENIQVDAAVLAKLEQVRSLAPIHNPPAIDTLKACRNQFPELPQVVVSDTAFHSSIPAVAAAYALPRYMREDMGFRKYGFHGISHQYVTAQAAGMLGIPLEKLRAVSCHLGSGGASLCAVVNGRSVDNTMGYSPLQGLVMSTRSGDLDPGITLRLLAEHAGNIDDLEGRLNRKSGVLGLSGKSADIRDALKLTASGDGADRAHITTGVYLWRLRKYLGAYLAIACGAHAVIFTDTIGELVPEVRQVVCSGMEAFGVKLDHDRNTKSALPCDVAADDSRVRIMVIPTNEELSIARSAYGLLAGSSVLSLK